MRQIHIGELIRKRAKEMRIGPTELGKLINTSKQNVYGIFRRPSVDSELLMRLSKALQFNFFSHYAADKQKLAREDRSAYASVSNQKLKQEISDLRAQLALYRKDLQEMREKYELLVKINTLLEKK